ncbi:MAG: CDGSH iron-sulfur domain-containing protein, partial [Clostridiaceae bacterium]|nr:CDGSH iron-sulfur domain-containing protein [Clostridiaceae bacterium]
MGTNEKIKILKDGPYVVTGNVPLSEKIIVSKGKVYELEEGRQLPQAEEYALCRCGKSKNSPFCDGSHIKANFDGTEIASRDSYADRSEFIEGPGLDLMDDGRCAYARFCHQKNGSAWELTRESDIPENRAQAIQAASECPAGRLTAVDKSNSLIEPEYEPCIEILQDPEYKVSGPIAVKGGIPIEASDGDVYEVRNRVALCRCGHSKNKPFCDARHVTLQFNDK